MARGAEINDFDCGRLEAKEIEVVQLLADRSAERTLTILEECFQASSHSE